MCHVLLTYLPGPFVDPSWVGDRRGQMHVYEEANSNQAKYTILIYITTTKRFNNQKKLR